MTWVLARKLLRDVAVGLCLVALLLFAFQCLWAKVADKISHDIIQRLTRLGITVDMIREVVFEGPGQIIQALMGGADIHIERRLDMMSISYIHPLTLAILCVWAVGRASGAIAGEIDRGTMELLLAQPIPRPDLILAHFIVDIVTIFVLCLSIWAGTWTGAWIIGQLALAPSEAGVDPVRFAPALLSVALLLFAVSGYSLLLSSLGRFRWRVLGLAVMVTLVQFLLNVIGQLWDAAAFLRPFTVFYYYQPQPMILSADWSEQAAVWIRLGVLLGVGTAGYLLSLWTFCRRDLPAPL
jgi:ABC-2 type transport system permease protein